MNHSKAQQIITQACGAKSWLEFVKFCGNKDRYNPAIVMCWEANHSRKVK